MENTNTKSGFIAENNSFKTKFVKEFVRSLALTPKGEKRLSEILSSDKTDTQKITALRGFVFGVAYREIDSDAKQQAVMNLCQVFLGREREIAELSALYALSKPLSRVAANREYVKYSREGKPIPQVIIDRLAELDRLDAEKKLGKVATATETTTTTPVTPIAESTTEELVTRLEVAREKATSL
jgi:hypothetical protein